MGLGVLTTIPIAKCFSCKTTLKPKTVKNFAAELQQMIMMQSSWTLTG